MLRFPLTTSSLKRPRILATSLALPLTISPPTYPRRLTMLAAALTLAGMGTTVLIQHADPNPHPIHGWVQTQVHSQEADDRSRVLALAEQAAWQAAFEKRQAALEARRQILADRITAEYQVAPQAASFLVRESERAAAQHHVDPVLLMAIVGVESRFNPYIISSGGAVGLVQMVPSAHPAKVQEIKARGGSLVNPTDNLYAGASILADYLALNHGNQVNALQQYNGAAKNGKATYAKKVLGVYSRLSNHLPSIPVGPEGPPPLLAALARA